MIMHPNELLSDLLEDAARIYHDSYDTVAMNAAKAKAEVERLAQPDNHYHSLIDFNQFHTKTLREACELACKNHMYDSLTEPVYLLLTNSWIDSLKWASKN